MIRQDSPGVDSSLSFGWLTLSLAGQRLRKTQLACGSTTAAGKSPHVSFRSAGVRPIAIQYRQQVVCKSSCIQEIEIAT